jgi:uncharacterized protein (DUF1501 family)
MNRRNFLRTSALSSIPLTLNGLKLNAMPMPFLSGGADNDRVLVLVQLNGGNDGINCVIPVDQYDALSVLRPNILIPENRVLAIESGVGLHPAMTHLQAMYGDGKMEIVQSVGYPNQDRSHFRSTDIWTSGSAADEYLSTGWLGRYFAIDAPDYPDGYPNADHDAPFALTIGSLVSETCQGTVANYSLALIDPFSISPLSEAAIGMLPDNNYGRELRFLIDAIAQTNAYGSVITDAANGGANMVTYPDTNRLAQQLKNVALLISGGLKTKVYVVQLGGFDTHSAQVDGSDATVGDHANLLAQLSEAIDIFHKDLQAAGLDERVLTMTFSEFGRQIAANDSLGTDHGNAAPLMLFGSCVRPGILGQNPQIETGIEPQAGVPMQYDFRSVYATVLRDWLGVAEQDIFNVLNPEVQFLPLVEGCTVSTALEYDQSRPEAFRLFPNPATAFTTMEWFSTGDAWQASLMDKLGHKVHSWQGGRGVRGMDAVRLALPAVPAGHYFIHLRQGNVGMTKGIVIQ